MTAATFWSALALAIVLEGLMLLLAPAAWRQAITHLLRMRNGQIRFFGLLGVGIGLALLWWQGR